MPKVGPVSHEDHLTLVEHLDELRNRLFVAIGAFVVAFAICVWQDDRILEVLNRPLPSGQQPITFGVTEPFITTLTVAGYMALLLSLPVILFQAYAFILPAFSPKERKVALPILMMVPVLFVGGVVFSYFIVLTPAVDFLLGFNASQFNIEVRARDYYSFVSFLMLAMGLMFQIPLGVLAAVRVGLATPKQLRQWRRYAYLIIAVVAALLPTVDPVSLAIEMVPLIILYELSILLAVAFGGGREKVAGPASEPGGPTPEGSG